MMDDFEDISEHPRGLQVCECCGGSGLREIREPLPRRHVPTGRVFCARCIARGCHAKPPPPDRPVLLSDLIRT